MGDENFHEHSWLVRCQIHSLRFEGKTFRNDDTHEQTPETRSVMSPESWEVTLEGELGLLTQLCMGQPSVDDTSASRRMTNFVVIFITFIF